MIELRFYNERYNMDLDYYSGTDDVYLTLYFSSMLALRKAWDKMFDCHITYGGHFLEGETYSAWDEDGKMLCGGAFDPGDIEIIEFARRST